MTTFFSSMVVYCQSFSAAPLTSPHSKNKGVVSVTNNRLHHHHHHQEQEQQRRRRRSIRSLLFFLHNEKARTTGQQWSLLAQKQSTAEIPTMENSSSPTIATTIISHGSDDDDGDGDDDDDDDDKWLSYSPLGLIGNFTEGNGVGFGITTIDTQSSSTTRRQYNWKEFLPTFGWIPRLHWLVTGSTRYVQPSKQVEQRNWQSLARLLVLLNVYQKEQELLYPQDPTDTVDRDKDKNDDDDDDDDVASSSLSLSSLSASASKQSLFLLQRQLLRDLVIHLYGSGTPTWVLETVMTRVAEGLTGRQDIEFMMLPYRCLIHYPVLSSSSSSSSSSVPAAATATATATSKDWNDGIGGDTDLFRISSGFYMAKLGAIEQVAVRLASFASNTKSVERLNSSTMRIPKREELQQMQYQAKMNVQEQVLQLQAQLQEAALLSNSNNHTATADHGSIQIRQRQRQQHIRRQQQERLAKEILDLASSTYGLFFYLNSPKFQKDMAAMAHDKNNKKSATSTNKSATSKMSNKKMDKDKSDDDKPTDDDFSLDFWQVSESTRQTFCQLAANEAAMTMARIHMAEHHAQHDDKNRARARALGRRGPLYPPLLITLLRITSAAGACAMWFRGTVYDMIVSATLAIAVSYMDLFRARNLEERVLTEVVASFVVGVIAGLLTLTWPRQFHFGALAFASVLDLLQGFKVVFAVIEVMSKNIVAGTCRLMEGILFTGLISYSLKFGLSCAIRLFLIWTIGTTTTGSEMPAPAASEALFSQVLAAGSGGNIPNHLLFPVILPLAAAAWSALFRPNFVDLPLMMLHVMLAVGLTTCAGVKTFVAAMAVTFLAGVISRFTGRQALGNTMAGLYALMPGTYMVQALLSQGAAGAAAAAAVNKVGFMETVLFEAAAIGLGGWTGTVLCSPTILGKSSGFHTSSSSSSSSSRRDRARQKSILYF